MNLAEKIKNDEILNTIADEFDPEIYLVGGAVRDFLLGKNTYDRDLIVCNEDARVFSQKLAQRFGATFVPLDEVNRIYRLVFKDKLNYLDITNPVENSLEADIKRRDLTINAIAVNIKSGEVIDLTGGLDDIKNKKINFISEQNFIDDPLRLLRIYRFQAGLGFDVVPELSKIVKKHKKLIHKPAYERVIYEIVKLFGGNYTHLALLAMDEAGLLEEIFPVMAYVKKVPPNSHHHLDLFHHSVETVRQVNEIYKSSPVEVKEHLDRVDFGGLPRIAHLKLAGFLHDIGKFSTWTIEQDTGRHRFIKHDDVGSKMALKILKDMHFSNKQVDYITLMIKNHIYPSHVMCSPTDKTMMRFVRKTGDNSVDNIVLAMADRLSARGPEITEDVVNNNILSLKRLAEFYFSVKETLKPLPKLLDGNQVMKILKIKPSPLLGEIMDALHDAQFEGSVVSKEDAVDFVKNFYHSLS